MISLHFLRITVLVSHIFWLYVLSIPVYVMINPACLATFPDLPQLLDHHRAVRTAIQGRHVSWTRPTCTGYCDSD